MLCSATYSLQLHIAFFVCFVICGVCILCTVTSGSVESDGLVPQAVAKNVTGSAEHVRYASLN